MFTKNLTAFCFAFVFQLMFGILSARAQGSEYYFSDTESKDGIARSHIEYENSIIFGGQGFERYKHQPVITRVDTSGNVLWKTSDFDTITVNGIYMQVWKLVAGTDGFVYALCGTFFPNTYAEWWKIDPTNGLIIWRHSFNSFGLTEPSLYHLIDYDSTSILVCYQPNINQKNIAFVSKSTGDTLSTHVLFNDQFLDFNAMALCTDAQKDIYYSKVDSIFKRSGANPDSVIWKVMHPSVDAEYYSNMYVDPSTGSLFCIGTGYVGFGNLHGKVVKMDPTNGAWISTYSTPGGENYYFDMKIKGNNLFVIWERAYVGGGIGYEYIRVSKYDMSTGTGNWFSFYECVGVGDTTSTACVEQDAFSLDVDSQGDVYITGQYGAFSIGGDWVVLKMDGASGNVIYEKTISLDTTFVDVASVGKVAYIFNDRVFFIGELQTQNYYVNYGEATLMFAELNPTNGNVLVQKYIGGDYQFPAKTLQIEKYQSNQTLVMKQNGRKVKLEMYDFNKNIIWEQDVVGNYFLNGGQFTVSPSGEIFMTSTLKSADNTAPFYDNLIDSIVVYRLDGLGNILKTYSFYVGSTDAFPVEIHSDLASTLLLYQKNDTIFYRKITSNTISSEYNSQFLYNNSVPTIKYCYNANSTTAYLFGRKTNATRIVELNKNTMATTNMFVISNQYFHLARCITGLGSNLVLVGGSNGTNEALFVYNISTQDTVWIRNYASTGITGFVKFALDDSKTYVYLTSVLSGHTTVKKIKVLDGSLVWETSYNGTVGLFNLPLDISVDNMLGQVVVTGYEHIAAMNQVPLILVFDTSGTALDTLVYTADFPGNNQAYCTNIIPDGSQWIGGNLNKNAYGLAGFIFERLQCSSSFQSINETSCGAYVSPSGIYTWTSSGTYTDTISAVGGCDSILTINLTIAPPITVTITATGSTTFCKGDSVLLSGTPGFASYQWYRKTFLIPGATQPNYYAKHRGRYSCVASDGVFCSDTSNFIQVFVPCMPVGPNQNREFQSDDPDESLLVYPNPGTGLFAVESMPGLLKLYNVTGQLIYFQEMIQGNNEIDLSNFPDGLYSFTFESENRHQTKKVLLIRE